MPTFRRIRGRIVPIKSSGTNQKAFRVGVIAGRLSNAGTVASAAIIKKQPIKPHFGLQTLGFGSAVVGGVLSGATFFSKGKSFLASQALAVGLDIGSTSANVAAFAGRGKLKERAKGALRQEGINLAAGYAAFGGTLLADPRARTAIKTSALKFAKFARKIIL